MTNQRWVKAKIEISCQVLIDDDILTNISNQYMPLKIDEAANSILYSWINPKIPLEYELFSIEGNWDGVCDYKGRFRNMEVKMDE
ncbi:hypothetical protein L5D93_08255 [Paenibacillus thiaminolyticus]|nr:hypothetical protein [Paenibacillus thiaminolyticus]